MSGVSSGFVLRKVTLPARFFSCALRIDQVQWNVSCTAAAVYPWKYPLKNTGPPKTKMSSCLSRETDEVSSADAARKSVAYGPRSAPPLLYCAKQPSVVPGARKVQ